MHQQILTISALNIKEIYTLELVIERLARVSHIVQSLHSKTHFLQDTTCSFGLDINCPLEQHWFPVQQCLVDATS